MVDLIGDTEFKDTSDLSMFNYLFNKKNIQKISIEITDWSMDGNVRYDATIRFANGNTKGSQEIKGESFKDLCVKCDTFLNSL